MLAKLQYIQPFCVSPKGLTLIDTPGLGGLFKSHAEILWRYAPVADAVFFVLDSVEAVASRPEMDALERLRKMTPLLFFVQTKTDLSPQEQWREWQTRNLGILAETLQVPQETLRYFPLSAKLKQQAADKRQSTELLRDSGYEALLHFIQTDLMAFKDAYLASQLVTALAAEVKSAQPARHPAMAGLDRQDPGGFKRPRSRRAHRTQRLSAVERVDVSRDQG